MGFKNKGVGICQPSVTFVLELSQERQSKRGVKK